MKLMDLKELSSTYRIEGEAMSINSKRTMTDTSGEI